MSEIRTGSIGRCNKFTELLNVDTSGRKLTFRTVDEDSTLYIFDDRFNFWLSHTDWSRKTAVWIREQNAYR